MPGRFRIMLCTVLGALLACMMPAHAMAAKECRQFIREHRAGSNMDNRYGLICKQPDGSWREVVPGGDVPDNGGHFIRPEPDSYPRYGSGSHTHYFDNNTRVIISDRPYVVIDPYPYWRGYGHDWSPSKQHFHDHHRGPGWQKHWKHHERTLNGQ